MENLLFDEQPIVINTNLAVKLGLPEAIVLQQVAYWIKNNKKNNINFRDGKFWTYRSIAKWQAFDFNFLSVATVRRAFEKLESVGYLITGNYNKQNRDKTKWYTLNDNLLNDDILLLNNEPVVVLPNLAKKIGLSKAIVLQKVNYLVNKNKENNINFYKNTYWTYNSIKKWQSNHFKFWSDKTVSRIFGELVEKGYLISEINSKDKRNTTYCYTVNNNKINDLLKSFEKKQDKLANASGQFEQMQVDNLSECDRTICTNAIGQFEQMRVDNLSEPLQENNKENHIENNKDIFLSNPVNINNIIYNPKDNIDLQLERSKPKSRKYWLDIIKTNVKYNDFNDTYKNGALEIINLITDIMILKQDNIKINSNFMSLVDVQDKFLELEHKHILYVLDVIKDNAIEGSKRSYKLTVIYNAASMIDSYYESKVQRDLESKIQKENSDNYDTDDWINYNWLD